MSPHSLLLSDEERELLDLIFSWDLLALGLDSTQQRVARSIKRKVQLEITMVETGPGFFEKE